MMVSFVLSFFPRDVLDEILNLIGSVSEGFPSYFYKTEIVIEKYLINLPINIYLPILKFRTTNHRLPVELGRLVLKTYDERKCLKGNSNSVRDETHYLLECDFFKEDRQRLVEKYFFTCPNITKVSQLLNINHSCVIKMRVFMNIIIRHFENE